MKKQICVFFAIASSKITAEEQAKIDEMAAYLKDSPKMNVHISGYADASRTVMFICYGF